MTHQPKDNILSIILAAGKGTRMQSSLPKVLHKIGGRAMVNHVIAGGQAAGSKHHVVVVGDQAEQVAQAISAEHENIQIFEQHQQLGTAHAVLSTRQAIESFHGTILILYGDTPLIQPQTLQRLIAKLDEGNDLAVLGFEAADPTGYGRLLTNADQTDLIAIREHKDASANELKVNLCNSGVFVFRSEHLLGLLDRVENNNAKSEYYLTDVVEIAKADGLRTGVLICPEQEVLGVNSRAQLAVAENVLQRHLRQQIMENGVTLIAPETVFLSYDTSIGRDTLIEPNVVFHTGVCVDENVHIRAFSYFENCHIQNNCIIGPYARIRPESVIGSDAKVGNFVEIKKAVVDQGAKINHLTYIGDAHIGSNANVGAGTIVCNYDGFFKYHTEIGANAFIGSNSSLVAPVKIGDGAFVGSGSVITKDVAPDALSLTRASQTEKEDWAHKFRTVQMREKERRKSDEA
ncbi:MAG: bifunctional UDP-N-acetylglucosamine diphosphorylase/glucosamine-1-phosphate N-acetyltransferase GlmU [Pseudomonadota bacterium]